MANDNKLLG